MSDPPAAGFSIRTITAGVTLESVHDLSVVEQTASFLETARTVFVEAGFLVQSTRIATQPLATIYANLGPDRALLALQKLDQLITDLGVLISVGPLLEGDAEDADFPSWAADLVATTNETYFSVAVADDRSRILHRSVRTAARTMQAISRVGSNGEANFRFGAAAGVPSATPFFPVAYHSGDPAFSIGLESAGLVGEAIQDSADLDSAKAALRSTLDERLLPIQTLATGIAAANSRRYAGIDLSPAPSVEASIAMPIEGLTGRPFGAPTTLAACAAITQTLQSTSLLSCGYSGLMLPLLEDRVLAQRASEDLFGVQDLLLFSSVCGTGLDVIPLPGDCDPDDLAGVILDMATLATRLGKPLAARLLPIPGKNIGDVVGFVNPHLTTSVVLPIR